MTSKLPPSRKATCTKCKEKFSYKPQHKYHIKTVCPKHKKSLFGPQ